MHWRAVLLLMLVPAAAFSQEPEPVADLPPLHMPINISLNRKTSLGDFFGKGRPVINYVSVNLFSGEAARLRGVEIGGLANIERERMTGMQAAGLANMVGGSGYGVQLAGLMNADENDMAGVQAAGMANIVGSSVGGIQVAGFGNLVDDHLSGIQLAGFGSLVNGSVNGVEAAGLANIVNNGFNGIQVAGVANMASRTCLGLQVSGIANIAEDPLWLVQMAPFNICGGGNVLPLGLVSVIAGAPTYYDVWLSGSGFVNAGMRSGAEWFNNLVCAGVQVRAPCRWTLGWGAGFRYAPGDRLSFNLEGGFEHINEGRFWTGEKNLLGKATLLANWRISESIAVFAGPTWNHLRSRLNDGGGIAPVDGTLRRSGDTWIRTWAGFEAGVSVMRPEPGIGLWETLF